MKRVFKYVPILMLLFVLQSLAQPKVFVKYEKVKAQGYKQAVIERDDQEIIYFQVNAPDTAAVTYQEFALPIAPNLYADTLLFNYSLYLVSADSTAAFRVNLAGSFKDGQSPTILGYFAGGDSTLANSDSTFYVMKNDTLSGSLKIGPPFYPYYDVGIDVPADSAAPADISGRVTLFPVIIKN